jgi:glycosyltransferase involved in cell wall biosynthesis
MALGKVCVASDVGGLKELVRDGETGSLFASGDARDLAVALTALMDDPAKRQQLGQAAIQYVKREREWSAIVARYRELYAGLLRSRAGSLGSSHGPAPGSAT